MAAHPSFSLRLQGDWIRSERPRSKRSRADRVLVNPIPAHREDEIVTGILAELDAADNKVHQRPNADSEPVKQNHADSDTYLAAQETVHD